MLKCWRNFVQSSVSQILFLLLAADCYNEFFIQVATSVTTSLQLDDCYFYHLSVIIYKGDYKDGTIIGIITLTMKYTGVKY